MIKKKILVITSLYPSIKNPSYGSFIKDQIKLVDDVYEFKILIDIKEEYSKSKFVKILFNLKKLLNVFKIKKINNEYCQEYETIALQYSYFSFYIPPSFQLRRIIRAFDKRLKFQINSNWIPDLIHAHYLENAGIIANCLGEKYNIPVIISEHNAVNFCDTSFWSKKAKNAYFSADKFLVASHHEKRRILTFSNGKIPNILHSPVDEEIFQIFNKNKNKNFNVLFVGYPHPIKGMSLLFEVINQIKEKQITNIMFQIISSDYKTIEFPKGIKEFIIENKLDNYCELLCRVEKKEMITFYKETDLFLSTSINETLGLSMVEALMCGIPVVCTNSGGPEDFITPENGIMVPVLDTQSLVEAIIKIKNKELLFDPNKIRESV